MLHSRIHIEEGDLVIVYFNRESMIPLTITPGEHIHNKYGRYSHDSMIGQKFGSKLYAPKPHAGYVHLLRPSPELWTLSLPHRTQILYMTDIAFIIQRLGVRPGSTVFEAGTGSGSMTHSLSRAVGERGRVQSFEYHEARFKAAGLEFESHGLKNVHLEHANVCKDGFKGHTGADAVFLDLPAPWEAIPYAKESFNPDVIARICCFSPCLEQVLKTVSTLRAEGFEEITTQEVLTRTHDIVAPPKNNATAPAPLRLVTDIVNGLKEHETRKEERRAIQMKTAREKAQKKREEDAARAAQAAVEGGMGEEADAEADATNERGSHKRKYVDIDEESLKRPRIEQREPIEWVEPANPFGSVLLSKPAYETRGHTSYLTFAALYPKSIRDQLAAQGQTTATSAEADDETDYGDDGMDEVLGKLTDGEIKALAETD